MTNTATRLAILQSVTGTEEIVLMSNLSHAGVMVAGMVSSHYLGLSFVILAVQTRG